MTPLDYLVRGTHFTAKELAPVGRKAAGNGPALKAPPLAALPDILPTLRVAEDMRLHFDKPVLVLSGYRDAAYNTAIGGSVGSLHMAFNALDLRVVDVDAAEVADWLLRHALAPWMGIGLYVGLRFVHIDTRALLGRDAPARWSGSGEPRWW